MSYKNKSLQQLTKLKVELECEHSHFKTLGLKLDMSRGKPSSAQLKLSNKMYEVFNDPAFYISEEGVDCRNYGGLEGIYEARRLMSIIVDDEPENTIVVGNSSLTMMWHAMSRFMDYGTRGSRPWHEYDEVKWICPVPGYDRHFAITESLGIKSIPVPMTEDGPDMDEVERIVASDQCVKGIWCVPKYSNPTGITYSDEVVNRLGHLKCAAHDFRIFWDNAYGVHHLINDPVHQDKLLDIAIPCRESGNPNRYLKFGSTSKITFAGAGIAALASSPDNIKEFKERMSIATIGGNKINQRAHALFLKDKETLNQHMSDHAALIRPKFELVDKKLTEELSDMEGCSWSKPRGGYFISFNAPHGTAKKIVRYAADAGVVMTPAGATWPLGNDPYDSNIRIAPSIPTLDELERALEVFCCCVKLAYVANLLNEKSQ